MLYHVPDIEKAISEVHRILRQGGTFYASTFGENGLSSYIDDCLYETGQKKDKSPTVNFTLKNGEKALAKQFKTVKRIDYEDSLKITDVKDLIQYICSMTSTQKLTPQNVGDLIQVLEKRRDRDGFIVISKEYGAFVSTKE